MKSIRKDNEPPPALSHWGWRYHHLGIPTTVPRPGERYLPALKCYVSGFPDSPFGIEWMRFEPGSPVHPLILSVPHLAFEVGDLDRELAEHPFPVLTPPTVPSGGVRVAMIEVDGAPVELLEFERRT